MPGPVGSWRGNRGWMVACGVVALAILSSPGCGHDTEITSYTIPKEQVNQTAARANDRMLAAIVPQGRMTWFFKLVGAEDRVTPETDRFVQWVRELRFDAEGKPVWEMPEGWTEEPGSGMRYASIRVQTERGPVEMSVIPLPTGEDLTAYLLDNVNRWRRELGLAPLAADQLPQETTTLTIESDPPIEATLINFKGQFNGGAMRGPMAGMLPGSGTTGPPAGAPAGPPAAGPAAASSASGAQPPAAAGEMTYTLPDGWRRAQNDSFSLYAFETGDPPTRITVTPAGGDLASNLNRWRAQVGAEPLPPDQVVESTSEITFAGGTGRYLAVSGPQGQGILGVIAQHDGTSWFIKMRGDWALLQQQESAFRSFVQSIAFR